MGKLVIFVLRNTRYASPACNLAAADSPPRRTGRRDTLCAGQARLQRLERSDCGQAMIEFTIALVATIAVVIGTTLLNRMEWAHTHTMITARATAGALALAPVYQGSLDARFISDWQTGADNISYTHDDEPIPDGTAITLTGNIIETADLDAITAPTNALSRLQSSHNLLSELYLVKGSESIAVYLSSIPGIGRLISGEPVISVESDVWLIWTRGIY